MSIRKLINKFLDYFYYYEEDECILKTLKSSTINDWELVESREEYDNLPEGLYLKTVLYDDYKDLHPMYYGGGIVHATKGATRYYIVLPKTEGQDYNVAEHIESGLRYVLVYLVAIVVYFIQKIRYYLKVCS